MAGQFAGRSLQTLPILAVVQACDGAKVIQRAAIVTGLSAVTDRVGPEVPADRNLDESERISLIHIQFIGLEGGQTNTGSRNGNDKKMGSSQTQTLILYFACFYISCRLLCQHLYAGVTVAAPGGSRQVQAKWC